MKTNLLLLDTMKNMRNLICSAFSLSNQLKRKLKIVYVLDIYWVGAGGEFVGSTVPGVGASYRVVEKGIRKDFEQAESEMRRITAEYFEKHPQNVHYEIEVAETNRLEMISKTVDQEKDVLLLMSNYNTYSGLSTGTISYPNIIDKVPCPVLVVPDNLETFSLNNYLYATALHSEDLKAIKHLSETTAGADGKNLTIFHNMETLDFESKLKWIGFKSLIKESVSGFHLKFEHSHEKNVREGLKKYLTNERLDVIVILKEKRGFFEDLFSSSETHYVVSHFDKPVLVYHEENLK
ncbi:universal stress protein [uncultured Sunxiuqinia sp.]|jgi:universal stress protein family protein|uniref:universal stress protein n=1 Tax=uncultured Sunxiuqinia sp. TaxID=1573825 RepID=UPI0030DD615C|tara:strand:- start:16881 stop:17759 length:879 start_codon:yes stop_codon:yes gene_type:complete